MDDRFKTGIGDFVAVFVETRRAKHYIERLPIPGRPGGVDAGRVAFETLRRTALVPTAIDAAALNARIL